jgi:hypothetical protein
MKTIPFDELFTGEQLTEAAAMMYNCATPHEDLVQLLKKDKARFDRLDVDISYAAYILEWKREHVLRYYLQ